MSITIGATYENGVLKPIQPLALKEHEKVQVTVHTAADVQKALDAVQTRYGLIQWTGSQEDLDYLINNADNDPLEGP